MNKLEELWGIYNKHALSGGGAYMVRTIFFSFSQQLIIKIISFDSCFLQTKHEFFTNFIKLRETCISDQIFKFIGKYVFTL